MSTPDLYGHSPVGGTEEPDEPETVGRVPGEAGPIDSGPAPVGVDPFNPPEPTAAPAAPEPTVEKPEKPAGMHEQARLTADEDRAATGESGASGRVGAEASEVPLGPTGRPLRTFPDPAPLVGHGPARVIALCNQKGGVGKTTTTINLGAALAEHGRRVLLLDFDPQGALSVGLGINAMTLDRTVYDLLTERGVAVEDVILQTNMDGVDLLPSNIDLSGAEVQLVNEVAREQALSRVLRPVLDDYDYVLIDCQPSLGLLTVNALTAAHGVIVPLECEFFSLRGVALLIDTVEKVRERLNPGLALDGILATMFDARTVHTRQVLARVVERFGDRVFDTVISRTVRFPETTVAGEPITSWAPTSKGAIAYRDLARELLSR